MVIAMNSVLLLGITSDNNSNQLNIFSTSTQGALRVLIYSKTGTGTKSKVDSRRQCSTRADCEMTLTATQMSKE